MTDSAEYIFRNSDWITYLFIGLFGLISVMRFLYHERIVHTFGLFLSKRYLSYYFSSEANAIMNVYQALLFFIQISVIGLLVYFTNESYKFILLEPGFEGFLKIILFIASYFAIRFLMGFIVALIFDFKTMHIKLAYEKTNYLSSVTLLLLPFLVIYFYAANGNILFLRVALIVFLLLLIVRYSLLLINNKKLLYNAFFYFILYLCALEIAPLVFIFKLSI